MSAPKLTLAVLLVVGGLSSPTHAQFAGRGAVVGGYTPYGYSSGYGGFGGVGYGNYGYGGFGAYGSNGFYRTPNIPQTYNNLGGLSNVIRQNTGRSGSYRTGSNLGVGRARRVR